MHRLQQLSKPVCATEQRSDPIISKTSAVHCGIGTPYVHYLYSWYQVYRIYIRIYIIYVHAICTHTLGVWVGVHRWELWLAIRCIMRSRLSSLANSELRFREKRGIDRRTVDKQIYVHIYCTLYVYYAYIVDRYIEIDGYVRFMIWWWRGQNASSTMTYFFDDLVENGFLFSSCRKFGRTTFAWVSRWL